MTVLHDSPGIQLFQHGLALPCQDRYRSEFDHSDTDATKVLANTNHCFIEVAAVVFRVATERSKIQGPQQKMFVSGWNAGSVTRWGSLKS